MKTKNYVLSLLVAIMVMACFSTSVKAQARPYTKGHVWTLTMIKTLPGMTDDYLTSLKTTVKAMEEEGIKQGLEVSYKIFMGPSANDNDFDVLIMSEFADMSSATGNDDKWDAIQQKVIGDNGAMKQIMGTRTPMRTILGDKVMQEITLK